MSKMQPVRGTKDILSSDAQVHQEVIAIAREFAVKYNYEEIITPIFEFSDVFHRTLGDTSDIISKETYTFNDRDGSSITLRPEFTAGVVRAFISNGLTQTLPQKLFSAGPVFRHERPQKCRYRQFNQINCEFLGAKTPASDVEMIALAYDILKRLGLAEYITLEINSLGDSESRQNYRKALVEYFSKFQNELSEDSKTRLKLNPLRILDSKDETDRKICATAPVNTDYMTATARDYFAGILSGLDDLGISYKHNPRLVRGLDYYSHTVFEFITDKLGSQGTVLAGGRYDGLVELMGGPSVPSIGFAAGVERLSELMIDTGYIMQHPAVISIIPIGDRAEAHGLLLSNKLREAGLKIDFDFGSNIAKRMKRADKLKAKYAVIFGDDELNKDAYKLKEMATGDEKEISSYGKLLECLEG